MQKSFKSLRKFINIRNLCFFIFKVSVAFFLLIFLVILSFIVIFSVKPRAVFKVNNFLINYLNKYDGLTIDFAKNKSTLSFNKNLGLEYRIRDLKISYNNEINFNIPETEINVDFIKLFIGKIIINNIALSEANLNLRIKENTKKEEKNINFQQLIEENIKKISKTPIFVKNISIKNLLINTNINKQNNEINIENFIVKTKLKNKKFHFDEKLIFNVNNSKNIKLDSKCNFKKTLKECNIAINNLNPNDFRNFINEESSIFNYLNNLKAYFDIKSNIFFDKNFKLNNGDIVLNSKDGWFYYNNFFDEKLTFKDFALDFNFDNNFENINIKSLNTKFNHVDFFMSLTKNNQKEYNDLELVFDIKNAKAKDLKRLWPNFLGTKDSRPWVIKHITDGNIPSAKANLKFRYFNDKNKDSGLQSVDAEIKLDDVLVDYDKDFPEVKNVYGTAFFTEKDMKIYIEKGNSLNSQLSNAFVGLDFTEEPLNLVIKSDLVGPAYNLFLFIDKNKELAIKNAIDSLVEDTKTETNLEINIPLINNLTFNDVLLYIKSNIFAKKNSVITDDANIYITFKKNKKSDNFFGKIDLTDTDLKFIPLNVIKPAKLDLSFNYLCKIEKDNIITIKNIKSNNDFISFKANGFVDIIKDKTQINIENITYNNSNYNLYYDSNIIRNELVNSIVINGKNINYTNIFEEIGNRKPLQELEEKESNAKNRTKVNLKLDYLQFANNEKIYNPTLNMEILNNDPKIIDFNANIDDKKFVKLNINKKTKMFELKSNNFGDFFRIIGLTNKIIDGSGEINFIQKNEDGKSIIYGNIDLNKEFRIITNDKTKEEVLANIKEEKKFKKLTKNLVEESSIRFDKMRGDITYFDNVIKFDEIVANSSFIDLQILALGFLNIDTEELQVKGLLIPVGTINGLFGINKLPVISTIIFGQKNSGLFASKFEVIKKDKYAPVEFHIDKFSMLMPGFLRNIFSTDTYKNIYNNLAK